MKTGLVVEGGGMKCAYSAGVIDGLLDDHITFDECIGVSSGSANTASFVAGQRGRNIRFYIEHPLDPQYCGVKQFFFHRSFFNLPYIFGTLTNEDGKDPLDYDEMMANPAEFLLVATDAKTGEAKYFSKHDMDRNDYRAIMASSALPALGKPIEIDGRKYFDGGVADPIPLQKAFEDGCDKVVVILENPRSFVRPPQAHKFIYHMMLLKYPTIAKMIDTRFLRYRECLKWIYELEKAGKIFVFTPPENSGVTTSTVDIPLLKKLYENAYSGYQERRKELFKYLKIKYVRQKNGTSATMNLQHRRSEIARYRRIRFSRNRQNHSNFQKTRRS